MTTAPEIGFESPTATYLVDAFTFEYPVTGIRVDMDRFVEEGRGGLTAEVVIATTREPHPGLLTRTRLNLLAAQTRGTLAANLARREPDIDWDGLLVQVSELAIRHWRVGDPLVDLEQGGCRPGTKHLLFPYLETGMCNTLFAYGGSGKSFFSLGMGISVASGFPLFGVTPTQTGNVLYLDWEADQYEHTERLHAIKAGAGITEDLRHTIFYRRQTASLGESSHYLRRLVSMHEIRLVIVDSMGPARGGELKDDWKTNAVFDAARSLGVTVLIVDHLPKGGNESDRNRPIGSVQSENRARNLWRLEKVQDEGEDTITVCLVHTKANDGRLQQRRAFKLHYDRGDDGTLLSVRFTRTNSMDVPDFRKRAPHHLQIQSILMEHGRNSGHGPAMSVAEIKQEMEADGITISEASVRATLNQYKSLFVQLPSSSSGVPRQWGLRAYGREADDA